MKRCVYFFVCAMAFGGLSCAVTDLPPEGQFVVHVTTDAPLPLAHGDLPSDMPLALFDRLSFEVFPSGSSIPCASCVREFEVDQTMVDSGRASVGVAPPAGQRVRLRVRLFRGDLDAPSPRSSSTLEQFVLLPPTPAEGVHPVTIRLHTENVGQPQGTWEEPLEVEEGIPDPGFVGTWAGAVRRGCGSDARSDEACIPGGPFWMGDPRLDLAGVPEHQGSQERLVVLAPYFLDREEVTVARFRDSDLAERTGSGVVFNPQPASSGSFCTYDEEPGPMDSLPVTCLTWRLANTYCQSLGKRLPTEAELAYASSALGTGSYVWGEEAPECEDAVFERGSINGACFSLGMGPAPVGSGVRDRLTLPSGEVVDLAGNVMEFAADFWQRDSEPCWKGTGVLWDPLCDAPSAIDKVGRSLRGGCFSDPPSFLRAALRTVIEGESKAVSDRVGFRCARSVAP